jgi:hypothetical protein
MAELPVRRNPYALFAKTEQLIMQSAVCHCQQQEIWLAAVWQVTKGFGRMRTLRSLELNDVL